MDQNTFDERTFAGILKTILLFLENYNFAETSQCFANEIKTRCKNQEFDDIVPRTLVLKRLSGELDKIVVTVTDSNEEKTLKVHRLCDVCSKDKKVSNVEG
ncbi:PREDICTED: uncharacterized protein LOC108562421 [Nicrophorus vespilloides]|uniref:Uncharacterized protein LOC108562421 n=1 Tax=Nicrophorus vespilloides TaxID=110193 RepID=A0ABM1MNT2_NICVS|nr:PREDICTED: uncharacterized protein LOC108562421 [Nicrophorus vespilloides]